MTSQFDFLNATDVDFQSAEDFISYIENDVDLKEVPSDLNFVGSASDHLSRDAFLASIGDTFEVISENDNLYLLTADTGEEVIPYYVYFDEDFPIFVTTANITDEMPPTINEYLRSGQNVGRFWLSHRQMNNIYADLVSRYDNLLVPFFSATRSPHSDTPAQKRPDMNRRITYYADDGLETYRELRYKYGVLPSILEFELPNRFKFKVKDRGVFTHERGSVKPLWNLLKREVDRKREVKNVIDTGNYGNTQSSIFDSSISVSTPWAINVGGNGIQADRLNTFEGYLEASDLEFGVSEYVAEPEIPGFEAELIDDTRYERTKLKTRGDTVRVYPRELTDLDQSFRIFNFVSDHFGPKCKPVEV